MRQQEALLVLTWSAVHVAHFQEYGILLGTLADAQKRAHLLLLDPTDVMWNDFDTAKRIELSFSSLGKKVRR
jgi:hypothetical protein